MKIVALTTVSSLYIVARYTAFAHKLARNSFHLIELGKHSATYNWIFEFSTSYSRSVLSEKPAEWQSSWKLFKNIAQVLTEIQPDVIILCGYGVPGMLEALLWSISKKIPAVLLSDSKEDDAKRSWWKEKFKSLIIKQYKSALVAGKSHKQYLIKLGMPEESIFLGYDVVGNESFHPDKIKHLSRPLNQPYFLAINRFIPKKNLAFLLLSYAEYRKRVGELAWDLVLAGEGELRSQLEKQIIDLELSECVHLPGFLQQEELLPYFAHAQCFIHASIQEQWGLVVNEAMAAGLPVLVSNRCGCFEDLVLDGINGFGFNPENQEELVQLMKKVGSYVFDLESMGKASLEHIQKFSPDYFAQSLMRAVEYAIAHS